MISTNRFARVVYTLAGVYGLLVMLPQYWMEQRIAQDAPPAITHVEYFYGFIGVCVAWQLVFLLIGRAPDRYQSLMPIAVIEKLAFAVPVVILYSQRRITGSVLAFGMIDFVLGGLFAVAYLMINAPAPQVESAVP